MFDPREKIRITANADSLLIACPYWANDIIRDVPSRRWLKAKLRWQVKVVKQNMEAIQKLLGTPGVEIDQAARDLIAGYGDHIKRMGVRNAGFPSWYRFKTEPKPYQLRACKQLYGLVGGMIEFRMQRGKSKTAIDLCCAHRMENHIDAVLVLTKRTLRRNWMEQWDKHSPLEPLILLPNTGSPDKFKRYLATDHPFKVMHVGWESLSQGKLYEMCFEFVAKYRCAVIGDETTFIAGHDSTRTEYAIGLAHKSPLRYAMTGTVCLEGPLQMFSQYGFIDWNIIGLDDFYAYKNRYCVFGGYSGPVKPGSDKMAKTVVGYKNVEELAALVAPFTAQTKEGEDYVLPKTVHQTRTVELTPQQRKLYDEVKKEGSLTFKGKPSMVLENVLEVSLRLQQIAGGYAVTKREVPYIGKDKDGKPVPKVKIIYDPVEVIPPDKNPKMVELGEYVEEWRGKMQGLIWAAYMPEIQAIVKLMKKMGLRVSELHGGIDERIRQSRHVNPFRAGDTDVLVGNAATGSMGYPLPEADVNCFYSNTVKAIDRVQAYDRNRGFERVDDVYGTDIIAERTIDVTIMKALNQKMDLADYIKYRVGEAMQLLDGEVE